MKTINPQDIEVRFLQQYLQGAIGPRPIAFAATVNMEGQNNLAPFSFFNVFSSNPPILVFSPAYSGRDGTAKHTLLNVKEVPEVVINIVNYNMVEQMSLASSPYPQGTDEFIKSGFTALDSETIRPKRVAQSPVQFECKVNEIKELGKKGGAGNLIICEVLRIHIQEDMLDADGFIDQQKIDLVSRMGGNWYARAHGEALFEVEKPIVTCGIGVDALPAQVRTSALLTGNDLGKLANVEHLPSPELVKNALTLNELDAVAHARELLEQNKKLEALAILIRNL
jgi:flavin reductase (DIM6/NTAB) family NADH-FMN oxidoreductase RutF